VFEGLVLGDALDEAGAEVVEVPSSSFDTTHHTTTSAAMTVTAIATMTHVLREDPAPSSELIAPS